MLKYYVYQHIRNDTGAVFYVGKGMGDRMSASTRRNTFWLRVVAAHGFTAQKVGLYADEQEAYRREIQLIAELRAAGAVLTNMTDGGEGTSGHRHTPEAIAYFAQVKRGKPRPRHVIEAMNNARRGAKDSEETRRKKSESATGRPMSPEAIAKVVAFHTGRKRSQETLERMSAAQKARVRKPISEAQREAIAKMLAAKPKGPPSDETRRRMSEAKLGKKRDQPMADEARKKLSESIKRAWERRRAAAAAAAKPD